MGIESFGVMLRAERNGPIDEVVRLLAVYPHMSVIKQDGRGVVYEFRDGECILEVLLRGSDAEAEFEISVRFALCNPDGVEARFIEFVKWVGTSWRPRLWQMSSALKDKVTFEPDELDDFQKRAPDEIRALRAVWQKVFGDKRGAVRVGDVFSWIKADGASEGNSVED